MTEIALQLLGQSGCRIECGSTVIYMDPYLSDSVQELDSPDLVRLVPVPVQPGEIMDADWVLITHDHIDHCDPHTLPYIATASPGCRFVGPLPVLDKLLEWGISDSRCQIASESWSEINPVTGIRAVPAAHPDIKHDEKGNLFAVGYILEVDGKRIYLAGDTSITEELIDILMSLRPITAAFLPVNEHNYYRGRRGIVGNMSVREAFLLADEIGVETVIPVHWDMFAANSVSPDEIQAVYRQMKPGFDLQMHPTSIVI